MESLFLGIFDATINRNGFIVSFSTCLLLVHRKATDFCINFRKKTLNIENLPATFETYIPCRFQYRGCIETRVDPNGQSLAEDVFVHKKIFHKENAGVIAILLKGLFGDKDHI